MKFLLSTVKYAWVALSWLTTSVCTLLLSLIANSSEEDSDPFEVDYPDYAPGVDKPGNAAMHDLMHHD